MIVARIQGHPTRAHLHDRLTAALAPLAVDLLVHESDPPDPWANYQRCLMGTTEDITHIVVAQDDCLPAPGFADAVVQIAERWPTTPVCLFMGALPAATASRVRRAKPDVRYVPLSVGSFVPLVCTMWPASVAREFLAWSKTGRGITRADDGNAARWARATKRSFVVTVPSIVQHDDGQPSVKGGRDHVPWAEKWRQALLLADDAASYDWLA